MGRRGAPATATSVAARRLAGERAGHIIKRNSSNGKRGRVDGADGIDFAPGMKLLKLEEFVSSRVFKAGALQGDVARRSKISDEDKELQLLVYGKFKADFELDPGGYDYVWMTVDDIIESEDVPEEDITNARITWREAQEEDWPTSIDEN